MRSSDLSSILRRLAETLSFARVLEDQPELRPGDLRKMLEEAAGRVEETDDLDESNGKPSTARDKRLARDAKRLDEAAKLERFQRSARAEEAGGATAKAAKKARELDDELDFDGIDDEVDLDISEEDDEDEPRESAPVIPESVGSIQVDVFVDGASKGNPGPSAVGYVIAEPGGIEFVAQGRFIGRATNNEAEYRALLRALEAAEQYGFRKLRIHSDSQLLIRQLEGRYRVNSPQLKALHEKAQERLAKFDSAKLLHIPRELNSRADALANEAVKAEQRRQKAFQKRRPK